MAVHGKLMLVQAALKAPKDKYNSFGKYSYRSAESILESVKPLLAEQGLTLVLADDVVPVANRVYVKVVATVTDVDTGESITNTAFAREDETKKGMDGCQITGAASSYARKYALNGLFAIDDTKDADTEELTQEGNAKASKQEPVPKTTTKAAQNKPAQKPLVVTDSDGMKVLSSDGAYHLLSSYDIKTLNIILHTKGYEAAGDTIRELMAQKSK